MNSSMTSGQMAQMKWMMYLMPIMFLGFFNNYAAGLTYYYFLANMFTMTQQFFMTRLIDEDAILAQLEANKKKPAKPKSKFLSIALHLIDFSIGLSADNNHPKDSKA